MKESIYRYLKVGLIHFMAYPKTTNFEKQENLIGSIKKILIDDYFNAIEITHIKDDNIRKEVKSLYDFDKKALLQLEILIRVLAFQMELMMLMKLESSLKL